MRSMNYITIPEKYSGQADAAFQVKGDSLEPIYSDGDYLLISYTSYLRHGDLGIFSVGGKSRVMWLCAENNKQRLIPLNLNYPEAEMTPDVQCWGKVVGRA